MAIGVVNDDSLSKELQRLSTGRAVPCHNQSTADVVEMPHRGRSDGDNNVPSSLRKIIGETSEIDGRASAKELARAFNISDSSISAYANGSTSTKSYHNRERAILDHINKRKLKISNRASTKLMVALDAITDEKLNNAKLRDIASVASACSAVIRNMEPEPSKMINQNEGVQFIVFAPAIVSEDKFDIIDLNE